MNLTICFLTDSQNRPSTPRGNEKIVQATPNRIENEDVVDYTLTMDSLMKTPRPYPNVTDAAGLHTDISMDMGNASEFLITVQRHGI